MFHASEGNGGCTTAELRGTKKTGNEFKVSLIKSGDGAVRDILPLGGDDGLGDDAGRVGINEWNSFNARGVLGDNQRLEQARRCARGGEQKLPKGI